MKHNLSSGLVNGTLTFCAALGGVGCMVSGFKLTGVDMWLVALFCLVFSFGFCFVFRWRRGTLPLLCLLGLLLGYFWRIGSLSSSVEALIYNISWHYNAGYGWGVLAWSGQDLSAVPFTQALCLLTCLIALALGRALSRGRGTWPAIGIALLPLISCIVLNDTVPGSGWLFLLLFGLILTALTEAVRRQDAARGVGMALRLALPVALALGLLFFAVPRQGYDKQDGAVKLEQLAMDAVNWIQNPTLPELPELQLPVTGDTEDEVNLSAVGPKSKQNRIVMEVELAKSGTLYLRGRAFDTYDGKGWTAQQQWETERYWPHTDNMESQGFVTVTTREAHSVIYQPVYPCDNFWAEKLEYGCVPNSNGQKIYTLMQGTPATDSENLWTGITVSPQTLIGVEIPAPETRELVDESAWLALPQETKLRAQALLGDALNLRLPLSTDEMEAAAQKIISYVRSSASYDLRTRRMPSGQEDFALWFLENSDTGYCVHFATATTVLLRAAGIPARYVTGYMVTGAAGETVEVPAHAAHAWSEYHIPGHIWKIAESTPADEDSPVPSAEPEQTDTPTRPSEQPDETQPGQTPDGTRPGETAPKPDGAIPGITGGQQQEEKPIDWTPLMTVLKVIGWFLVISALILGQWQLRLRIRIKRQRTGRPNRRALARWQEITLLARLRKLEIPEELYELAQKARFSQHTLTKEELRSLRQYQDEARTAMRSSPWYAQLYYRLVLALY